MKFDGVGAEHISRQLRGLEARYDRSPVKPSSIPDRSQRDELSLSSEARELHGALKAVQAAPDVRADRIAELRQQIADGTYRVPAETLVRDILRGG